MGYVPPAPVTTVVLAQPSVKRVAMNPLIGSGSRCESGVLHRHGKTVAMNLAEPRAASRDSARSGWDWAGIPACMVKTGPEREQPAGSRLDREHRLLLGEWTLHLLGE